jgi:hypothetical protein
LFEVVLHGRQKQPNQHPNNGQDDQKLNERKTAASAVNPTARAIHVRTSKEQAGA